MLRVIFSLTVSGKKSFHIQCRDVSKYFCYQRWLHLWRLVISETLLSLILKITVNYELVSQKNNSACRYRRQSLLKLGFRLGSSPIVNVRFIEVTHCMRDLQHLDHLLNLIIVADYARFAKLTLFAKSGRTTDYLTSIVEVTDGLRNVQI